MIRIRTEEWFEASFPDVEVIFECFGCGIAGKKMVPTTDAAVDFGDDFKFLHQGHGDTRTGAS